MGDYIKSVFLILLSGILVGLFLMMGLAILAAVAVILPFVYWWYKRKFKKILDAVEKQGQHGHGTVIEVEYEVVDDEEEEKDKK